MLVSLLKPDTLIKVSSTLDKTSGKKHLIDDDPETCWTSQQGLPQYIHFTFIERVVPQKLSLTFQGGFVGTRCSVHVLPSNQQEWKFLTYVYPEDVNRRQSFDFIPSDADLLASGVTSLKLIFEESSDFFGRITIYDLKLEGWIV